MVYNKCLLFHILPFNFPSNYFDSLIKHLGSTVYSSRNLAVVFICCWQSAGLDWKVNWSSSRSRTSLQWIRINQRSQVFWRTVLDRLFMIKLQNKMSQKSKCLKEVQVILFACLWFLLQRDFFSEMWLKQWQV